MYCGWQVWAHTLCPHTLSAVLSRFLLSLGHLSGFQANCSTAEPVELLNNAKTRRRKVGTCCLLSILYTSGAVAYQKSIIKTVCNLPDPVKNKLIFYRSVEEVKELTFPNCVSPTFCLRLRGFSSGSGLLWKICSLYMGRDPKVQPLWTLPYGGGGCSEGSEAEGLSKEKSGHEAGWTLEEVWERD